jgi:dsDNA-binding SOS-regulon protein
MDPTVVAAWIAAGVSVLTLIGTVITQIIGFRVSSRDAEKTAEKAEKTAEKTAEEQREQLDRTLAEQRDQLNRTLAEQNQQLDRTLAEQRTRTLNERFATAAEQLGSDKPAVRLAGVYATSTGGSRCTEPPGAGFSTMSYGRRGWTAMGRPIIPTITKSSETTGSTARWHPLLQRSRAGGISAEVIIVI